MRKALALTVVCLVGVGWTSNAQAHQGKKLPYTMQLIHGTDHAARVTQRCQVKNGFKRTKNPRNYAKPHSRGYRVKALKRWHDRRRACQSHARAHARARSTLGVPSWFLNIAMCIHRGESLDWYESYYEGTIYGGGLQYHPSTWIAAGGKRFAPTAYQATPAQQIRAAYDLTEGGKRSLLYVHWAAQAHCF